MIITAISIITTVFISLSMGLLIEGIIEKIDCQIVDEHLPLSFVILLGLFGVSFLLMLIHFFIPITNHVFIIFFFLSAVSLFLQRQRLKNIFSNKLFPGKNQFLLIPFLIVCGSILVLHSIDPNYEFDLGLYHLQNINWYQTYAIVPGLGNLHCRLAFNSNWFLLESLFGHRFIFGQPIFPINTVIIFSFIAFSLQMINKKENKLLSSKFFFLILILSTFNIFAYANSSSNDKPCDILIWIIIYLFLKKIETKTIAKWDKYSWVMILLSIFVFSIKVSSAIILLLIGVHILLTFQYYKKPVTISVIFSMFYLTIWFIRNIILSGTIIFPIPFLQIPLFDWSIPKNLISQLVTIINFWAIKGHSYSNTIASMSFLEKFMLWQTKRTIFFNMVLSIGLIGSIVYLIVDTGKSIKDKFGIKSKHCAYLLLNFYFVIAITYWYFSAPDPRFAFGPILASASWVISRFLKKANFTNIFIDSTLLILIVISVWISYITIPYSGFNKYIFKPPQIQEYSIKEFRLQDGNIINVPTDGIQCWDAPLPCTGWLYDGLIMRSSDLADGFKIEN